MLLQEAKTNMPQGLIVKALSGYYYVLPEGQGGETVQCRARGIFKKRGISPLVGDRVMFTVTENGEGTVDELFPRFSELIRPPVANISLAVLVFSVSEPSLNLQLLDKFLVHTEKAGLDTIICLTKSDLLSVDAVSGAVPKGLNLEQICSLYQNIGYQVIVTSARTGVGIAELGSCLSERISVFSGQSGVGKSSLVNALVPGLSLETNQISAKLGRGKHTTRHVELIPLPHSKGGFVADTPGFSQLDFLHIESQDLDRYFKDIREFAHSCKFRGCLHQHEPGCSVVAAVDQKQLAHSRYEHYIQFLTEIKERKRRY
jgi:ribosome biogenesis GTPase